MYRIYIKNVRFNFPPHFFFQFVSHHSKSTFIGTIIENFQITKTEHQISRVNLKNMNRSNVFLVNLKKNQHFLREPKQILNMGINQTEPEKLGSSNLR